MTSLTTLSQDASLEPFTKSLKKLQKMFLHMLMKTFIKLSLSFIILSSVSYAYELPNL